MQIMKTLFKYGSVKVRSTALRTSAIICLKIQNTFYSLHLDFHTSNINPYLIIRKICAGAWEVSGSP